MTVDDSDWFTNSPCGYIEVGADGVITAANSQFLKLVGRPDDEVVGQATFMSLLSVGDRIYHETHFRPMLEMHREVHEIAFELLRADGSRVPILVSANMRDGDSPAQSVTRAVVFEARDRRLYEQELLRTRKEAENSAQRARELAQALQQTFLPPSMPDVPGLEISGAYRPAGDGSEVGGDFYDVFQLRADEWMVVFGDVCGKGVDAAVVTAFVRHSVRALAVWLDTPSEILRSLNSALLAHRSERFCTVLVLRLRREDGRWTATVSSGGHPLPLLLSPDGSVSEFGTWGSLIGVLETPQLDDAHRTLAEGDSLVLYTDGVTEARSGSDEFGVDRLEAILDVAHDATQTTSAVLGAVLEFQGGQARDDIAIVTVRATAELASPETEERMGQAPVHPQ